MVSVLDTRSSADADWLDLDTRSSALAPIHPWLNQGHSCKYEVFLVTQELSIAAGENICSNPSVCWKTQNLLLNGFSLTIYKIIDVGSSLWEHVTSSRFEQSYDELSRVSCESIFRYGKLEDTSEGWDYEVLDRCTVTRVKFSSCPCWQECFSPTSISHGHQPPRVLAVLSMSLVGFMYFSV